MASSVFREYVRRVTQILVGNYLFEMPPLNKLRNYIYRSLFPIGPGFNTKYNVKIVLIHPNPEIKQEITIGQNVAISYNTVIDFSGGVEIKDEVWISQNVNIYTHNHGIKSKQLKKLQGITYSPLVIEEDAWIASNALVLGTVNRIGRGAIVAAGAVVTRDVGDYEIVAGNPARVIGMRE